MPIFALLLRLLYIRRGTLYVQHVVHTLHLHAVSLVLLSIIAIINLFETIKQGNDYAEAGVSILLVTYFLFSFRRVYQQGWTKTIGKVLLISVIYFFVIGMIGIIEAAISFMIF